MFWSPASVMSTIQSAHWVVTSFSSSDSVARPSRPLFSAIRNCGTK